MYIDSAGDEDTLHYR